MVLPKGLFCLFSLIRVLLSSNQSVKMKGCVGVMVTSMCAIKKRLLGIVGKLELAGCCCNWHVNMFALVL